MDSIFEKYSVFDFFNVISTGFVFLLGLEFGGIGIFRFLGQMEMFSLSQELDSSLYAVVYTATLLCVSYLIGSFLQSTSSLLQRKLFRLEDNAMESCLNDPRVVGGQVRLMSYRKDAVQFFAGKGVKISAQDFTAEQCRYFFSHCIYYIQVRGQHQKTEKMRELRGFSNMLATCFALLVLLCTGMHLLFPAFVRPFHWARLLVVDGLFIILALVFWYRMKKTISDRIRMVLGVYDACRDVEKKAAGDHSVVDIM